MEGTSREILKEIKELISFSNFEKWKTQMEIKSITDKGANPFFY